MYKFNLIFDIECPYNCKTCSDANTCISCPDNSFRLNTSKCECEVLYFNEINNPICQCIALLNLFIILACSYTCQTCDGNSENNCIDCPDLS